MALFRCGSNDNKENIPLSGYDLHESTTHTTILPANEIGDSFIVNISHKSNYGGNSYSVNNATITLLQQVDDVGSGGNVSVVSYLLRVVATAKENVSITALAGTGNVQEGFTVWYKE